MQAVRFCHILLFLLISLFIEQAHAQGGGSILQRVVDAVTSAVGDVGSFFTEAINTVVLQVATVFIGDDPEDLACSLIQDELAKQDGVTCTCSADVDVITTSVDMDGTCTMDRTCPLPGICGTCEATYDGTGDLAITDQSIDGSANLVGVCALNEIATMIDTTATTFVFKATMDFDGGFDSLKMSIASCSAYFRDDSTGTTVATCTCSPEGCGELQVSFNCTGQVNLASSGCVSIGLGGGQ